jgi:hypothetical protein
VEEHQQAFGLARRRPDEVVECRHRPDRSWVGCDGALG